MYDTKTLSGMIS